MKRILVRADDLGYSKGVNCGIEESVRNGIIKSVGFMVNMPESQRGWDMIKDLDVCLGLHTNICVGKPISDPKDIPSLVDEKGEFKSSKTYRAAKEDFVNLDEVILEIEAQYQKFKEITGKEPSYFEGHAVSSNNFYKGMEIVGKKYNLPYLAMDPTFKNYVPFGKSKMRTVLKSMDPNYDPVKTLKDMALANEEESVIPTMVCHPGYLDAYILKTSSLLEPRVHEVEMAVDEDLKNWLKGNEIQLVTYDDIR